LYCSYSLVLQRVRDALAARGPNTIRSLGRVFRQMDSYDGNNKIDKDEFLIGLKENGVNITKQEAYVKPVYHIYNSFRPSWTLWTLIGMEL